MTEAETVCRDLQETARAVALVRDSVRSGAVIDLAGLDRRVARLCTDVRALPAADSRALAPALVDLAGHIDRLAADMAAQPDRPADPATAAQAATAAYARPRR